jgi:hypothetical protein
LGNLWGRRHLNSTPLDPTVVAKTHCRKSGPFWPDYSDHLVRTRSRFYIGSTKDTRTKPGQLRQARSD